MRRFVVIALLLFSVPVAAHIYDLGGGGGGGGFASSGSPAGVDTQIQYNDAGGFGGDIYMRYLNGTSQILFGDTADETDFPNALTIISNGDTGATDTFNTEALVIESAAVAGTSVGRAFRAYASTASDRGVQVVDATAIVTNPTDTAGASAGSFQSADTHTGNKNTAIALYAAGSTVRNDAILFVGGDINGEFATLDWDLIDNTSEAVCFDTTGYAGLMCMDTTNGTEMVRFGSTAAAADFPNARAIFSQDDSAFTSSNNIGFVGESLGTSTTSSTGLRGFSRADGDSPRNATAVHGQAGVSSPTQTAFALAGVFTASDASAGVNEGVRLNASNGAENYAMRIFGGDIDSAFSGTGGVTWSLLDNDSASLSFDTAGEAGLLVIETTTSNEQVSTSKGFKPGAYTADPCGGLDEGSLFYNDTSNYMCFCDGTNDVQMHSPGTACF